MRIFATSDDGKEIELINTEYIHRQSNASNKWTIQHNKGKGIMHRGVILLPMAITHLLICRAVLLIRVEIFFSVGDAQKMQLIARGASNSTSAFDLTLDGVGANLTLLNYCTWFFVLHLSAMKTNSSALNSYSTLRLGIVARRNNAGSTVVSTYSGLTPDLSVGTFPVPTIAITADTTNGALKITITPTDATSTRWVAVLDICQVGNGASF